MQSNSFADDTPGNHAGTPYVQGMTVGDTD